MFTPVYNPMPYTCSSTNVAQDNFQYLFDLYITGVTGYHRTKIPADPNASGRCYYDPQSYLKDYLTKNIDKSDNGIKQNTSSYVAYIVKVGEEYGPSSGVTQYQDLLVDATRYAWNACLDPLTFRRYAQEDWVASTAYTGKFLTTAPDNLKLRTGTNAWVHFITSGTNVVDYIDVKTYTAGNVLIQTVRIDNPYTTVSSGDDRFLRMPIGPNNLNMILNGQISLGAQPIITASVDHYTVQGWFDDGFTQSASLDLRTYYIDSTCTPYDTYTFHFLNDMGGYDSFTTIRRSDHDTKAERKSFKRITGSITSTTAWDYLNSSRGKINYSTKINDSITVNSDALTDDEATWLEQLIYSPDVYLDDSTHGLVSVNINKDSYRREKKLNSDTFIITFSFEYSFNRYRQRS